MADRLTKCGPGPETTADAVTPLKEAVLAAHVAGALPSAQVDIADAAIRGQVQGLGSLELAQVGPPGMDWDASYDAALDAIARSWARRRQRIARGPAPDPKRLSAGPHAPASHHHVACTLAERGPPQPRPRLSASDDFTHH
ncbi:hypothetical protein [Arthrobacter liuii]|uniref:hypothetical protein n=1 Tax=Arthrobacter liuii TaxID=1476996 RepID=UPI001666CB11|nr:hypothetical protein [Arthrobacter liuii]